jgi:hypothetical protein
MKKLAMVALALALALGMGCGDCYTSFGRPPGGADGEACDLLARYNDRCNGESEDDPDRNTGYYDMYRVSFCDSASPECLARPEIAEFCDGIIDQSVPDSGT